MESRHNVRGQGQGPKNFRDQGQGQIFSRPKPNRHKCSSKKGLQKFFQAKKDLQKFFFTRPPLTGNKKRCSQIFREVSGVFQQNFNSSKNSAVLEPRTGQFLRTCGFEAKDFKMCHRGRPRSEGRPRKLHL